MTKFRSLSKSPIVWEIFKKKLFWKKYCFVLYNPILNVLVEAQKSFFFNASYWTVI